MVKPRPEAALQRGAGLGFRRVVTLSTARVLSLGQKCNARRFWQLRGGLTTGGSRRYLTAKRPRPTLMRSQRGSASGAIAGTLSSLDSAGQAKRPSAIEAHGSSLPQS
jgi:hypothetical protein